MHVMLIALKVLTDDSVKRHFSYGADSLQVVLDQVYDVELELSVEFTVVVFVPASTLILPNELDDDCKNPWRARVLVDVERMFLMR